MTSAGRPTRWPSDRYRLLEIAGVLGLLAVGFLNSHMSPTGRGWTGPSTLFFVLFVCLIPLVRRYPGPVLTVMAGMFLMAQREWGLSPALAMGLILAVFVTSAAGRASRRARVGLAALIAATVDLGAELAGDSWIDSRYLVMSSWVIGAAAVGAALRNRRAYLCEIEERAVAAEQSREHLAERRVAEERLRIARDVHDLVAHHIAVINVQAGVAGHLLERQPVAAAEALAEIRGSARSALQELAGLIGMLRQTGDESPLSPSPTVADVPQLLKSFESAGLAVAVSHHGADCALTPSVDLTAFRLIQESLTNAHKHGPGEAALSLVYKSDELVIDVVNPICHEAARTDGSVDTFDCGGNGLLGMRERVSAVGGTVRAGHTPEGRFHVHARLPISQGVG